MTIYTAIHTAIKAHENQYRKIDNDLYVAHPLEVGVVLAKNNMPDDVIIAGILHDTIEDTDMTLEEIERLFGPRVAMYVQFCSETNKSDTWQNRKISYLKGLEVAPLDVLYIVCADKLTNIKSIYRNYDTLGPAIWEKFNAGYEQQKWYYLAVLDSLSAISTHPLYTELKNTVALVFKS